MPELEKVSVFRFVNAFLVKGTYGDYPGFEGLCGTRTRLV